VRPAIQAMLGSVAVTLLLTAGCGVLPGTAQTPARAAPSAAPNPTADPPGSPASTDSPTSTDLPTATDPPTSTDPPASTDSTATSDSGDASCPADIVARICVEVNLTGATSVVGRGIVTAPAPPGAEPSTTCAAIAADHDGGNLGDHLDTVDGQQLAWDHTITDFHGPGTYTGSELHLSIDDDAYSATGGGSVAVTIGADFATRITMTNLTSSGGSASRESGTITWTCVDPTTSG
jgi:hypothetical protein